MTRRDYDLLAELVGSHLLNLPMQFVVGLGEVLAKDNPNFDAEKFSRTIWEKVRKEKENVSNIT